MDGTNFWLIYIQDEQVSVSLISDINHKYQILAAGVKRNWDINSEESLIKATDESLSEAALNANIVEDQEPELAAFVVPPFWVASDGKISAPKLKLIKSICKELHLRPSGFLSEDESIVENANQVDGFPASFILIHLSSHEFYSSLVYLGHVKERIRKNFDGEFNGQILESSLLEFNSESALPPQIIIFGMADEKTLTTLKNFPWVGKKNIETFLHFPEIKLYSDIDIINIFTKVITSQIRSNFDQSTVDDDSPIEPTETVEKNEESLVQEAILEETDAEAFGFSSNPPLLIEPNLPEPNLDPFVPEILPPPVVKNLPKINFSLDFLKKIKLPKFKLNNFIWIVLMILPFLFFIPFFFAKSQITLFVTPYQFNKSLPVTLKVDADSNQISQSIIPVEKQSFEIKATATISTTGQKTIGDKAKGEIIIYNKIDKAQNIPKGSILTDSSGKKFELTTVVSVASSSSNLDQGVITLGQTKTVIMATDIGSEFNINKDSQLRFKDFSDTLLIAKADANFTGGSKEQISAVSDKDKSDMQIKINQEIDKNIQDKINNDLKDISGIIKETIQSKKNTLELNREVGEQADELIGNVVASVTVFTVSNDVKTKLINQFLLSEPNFSDVSLSTNDFSLLFKIDVIDSQKATGILTLNGLSLPKIDLTKLKKSLTGKTTTKAETIIKKIIPRAYNFRINNNFPLGLLPFRSENVDIEVKIESL
ncbi:MAG: hypothetical protein WC895_01675 [Candidatus Shapirobacteria bacterium]|jgi:hypothetical protein